jgi:hypothetical protein
MHHSPALYSFRVKPIHLKVIGRLLTRRPPRLSLGVGGNNAPDQRCHLLPRQQCKENGFFRHGYTLHPVAPASLTKLQQKGVGHSALLARYRVSEGAQSSIAGHIRAPVAESLILALPPCPIIPKNR